MICPHCKKDTDVNPKDLDTMQAEFIVWACADHFQVPVEKVRGLGRHRDVVKARHLAMYLIRLKHQMYYTHIAEMFGLHHTTILYGIERVDNAIFTKSDVYDDLQILKERLMPNKLKVA